MVAASVKVCLLIKPASVINFERRPGASDFMTHACDKTDDTDDDPSCFTFCITDGIDVDIIDNNVSDYN